MNYLKIGHDNSGEKTCWFLKHAIVQDLQTNQKFYFKCQNWFSTIRNDCTLSRNLPVTNPSQMKEFSYFVKENTKNKIIDGHLWISIFYKPTQSNFKRVDRVTCCFVLLFLSKLMNILYYDIKSSANTDHGFNLNLGPFKLTYIEVINLINLLLINYFN